MESALAGLRRLGSGVPFLLQEAHRLEVFLAGLDDQGWRAPTRSAGWRRHDVVAHLASGEEYNEACFDGRLDEVDVFEDDEQYNLAHVARRRALSHGQVHAEWLRRRARAHAMFAGANPAEPLLTSAGTYPVGLQAWHIGMHYATHNDDIGVPIPPEQRAPRTLARARFCAYAIGEKGLPHRVVMEQDAARITVRGQTVTLPLAEFVDLVAGYRKTTRPALAEIRGIV